MIIGNGNIASVLNDREGVIFFASGVSDSGCKDRTQFDREIELMKAYGPRGVMFVYFSSIAIDFATSPYLRHKSICEHIVRISRENYCIIRLGNLWWDTNPNTFRNYIRAKQAKGEPVEIRDEYKYMINKEQLLFITDNLPLTGQHEISVFGDMLKVKDCL